MRTVAVWTAFVLAYSSSPFVAGVLYMDPISRQSANTDDLGENRVGIAAPSCDELRIMWWKFTKRQSRAARTTSLIFDPYYPGWKPSYEQPKQPLNSRGGWFPGRPRNRAGGNAPIYGKMVHKPPSGSRLRNGRFRFRQDRNYGTPNPYPSTRLVGGGSLPIPQIPRAGRFEVLKHLLQTERACELQELHREQLGDKSPLADENHPCNNILHRKPLNTPMQRMQPKNSNFEYGQTRYPSNVGQAWSRTGPRVWD